MVFYRSDRLGFLYIFYRDEKIVLASPSYRTIPNASRINSRSLGTFPSKMNPALYGQSEFRTDKEMINKVHLAESLIFYRRGSMISSPCKNCSRKNLPKDSCIKNCKLLQSIQDIQISATKSFDSSGIDYTEENRYTIPNSITKNNDSLWTI
jgi:hypothetical protein